MSQSQQLIEIGNGARGTRDTLKIMAGLVREARVHPAIRRLSVTLTQHLPNKSYIDEVRAVFEYVRDRVRYVQDINGVERLENPVSLLETMAGDCDDMCTLLAALLESIGHPCRFCAAGYCAPGQYEHVFLETRIGSRWIALDPTEEVDIGWAPLRPYVDVECHAMMKEYV